jgi:hypothetical protein
VAPTIRWSDHALAELAKRDLDRRWIMRTLAEPTSTAPDPIAPRLRAFRRIPEFGDRWLRMVYEQQDDGIRVITAFFDRGRKK